MFSISKSHYSANYALIDLIGFRGEREQNHADLREDPHWEDDHFGGFFSSLIINPAAGSEGSKDSVLCRWSHPTRSRM